MTSGVTNAAGVTAVAGSGGGGSGTVTQINTGTGLTGGPITASGTVSIANATVNTLAGYDNSGAFADVAIGTGLSLSAGTLTATGTGTVTTTGSPASGNLTKFSGALSITSGDLSGDVTTSGTLVTSIAANAVTTSKINNAAVTEAKIGLTNVTTNNVTTSAHGFAPILPGDPTKYLNGSGAYSTPGAGAGVSPALAPGVVAWIRPSALTGVNDGDPVPSITDLIGSFAFATGTAANQPTYYRNALGVNRPGLQFGGSPANWQDVQLAGTCAVTNGSSAVVGTSTAFTTATANNGVIYFAGKDGRPYLISARPSNTSLTLAGNWVGPTESGLKAYYRPFPVPNKNSRLENAAIAVNRASWWACMVLKGERIYVNTDIILGWNGNGVWLYDNGAILTYLDTSTSWDGAGGTNNWAQMMPSPGPLVVTLIATGNVLKVRINGRENSSAYTSTAGTLTGLAVGGTYGGTSASWPGLMGDIVIGSGALTSQQAADMENWIAADYGISFNPDPNKPLIIFDGNSISAGLACESVSGILSERVMDYLGRPKDWQYINMSYSGAPSSGMNTRFASLISPWITAARQPVVYVPFEMVNDANYTNYQTLLKTAAAAGAIVVPMTTPANGVVADSSRLPNNASLRTDVIAAAANLNIPYERIALADIGNHSLMAIGATVNGQTAQNVKGPFIWLDTTHHNSEGMATIYGPMVAGAISQLTGLSCKYANMFDVFTSTSSAWTYKYLFLRDGNYTLRVVASGYQTDGAATGYVNVERNYKVVVVLGAATVTSIGVDIISYGGSTPLSTADIGVIAATPPGILLQVTGEASKNIAWGIEYQISGPKRDTL